MFRRAMAVNLINRLSEHLEYNINIMNENGVIIASRDASRINTFHEAAYNIIHGDEEIEVIHNGDQLPPGVKPGVNLPILNKNKKIGVVGVTGNPDKIMDLAYSVKTAVEVMLEYEFYKEKIIRRQDKKNLLLNTLLYEEDLNILEVRSLATRLGYSDSLIRVPIILKFSGSVNLNEILPILKTNILHTNQDMSFITAERDILIFKVLDGLSYMLIENIKVIVNEFIIAIDTVLERSGLSYPYSCFVGSFQENLKLYKVAYRHARWLLNFVGNLSKKIYFFSDHIYEYLQSRIPKCDYNNIFSVYDRFLDSSSKKKLMVTAEALLKSNMSIKKAAMKLGIHRNTVYFRLENIKELLGIDPLTDTKDSFFLFAFYEYCKLNQVTNDD